MENGQSKNEIFIKENLLKIEQIMNKIREDYNTFVIDPINLDELRRVIKVN
jgi:hypothetical protein